MTPTARILTLCPECAGILSDNYKLNKISTKTTTEKQKTCEQCRRRFPQDILAQYSIAAKAKRRQ